MASISTTPGQTRRDWNWDTDGLFEGLYLETREVSIKNGPSAGRTKLVFDFHYGLEDELVSIFETTVLRSKFSTELRAREKSDFEPGERIKINPLGFKNGPRGSYRDFAVEFEFAAPKRSAAELLAAGDREDDFPEEDDDGLPY